jgi:hypothetical protein
MVTDGQGNLHLLWQPQHGSTTVWDQVSLDDGHTWQYPQGLPDDGGIAGIARDPAGRLNLVGVGSGALSHWLWDGNRWQSEAPLGWHLSSQKQPPAGLLAAAINQRGEMMVVLAEPMDEGNAAERTLWYSTRMLELPAAQTETQETPTKVLSSPTTTVPTSTPEYFLTPTASIDTPSANPAGQGNRLDTREPMNPLVGALLPVGLLLLSILGIVVWRVSRLRDR